MWIKRPEGSTMRDRNDAYDVKENQAERISESSFHVLDHPPLASDILKGVREITLHMLGTCDKNAIRSMYHRTETSNTIPTFKLGSMTCALKSSIRATIWMQEKRAWRGAMQEDLVRLHTLLSSLLAVLSERNGNVIGDRDETQLKAILAEAARTIRCVIQIEKA
jgi:hypothetical protein